MLLRSQSSRERGQKQHPLLNDVVLSCVFDYLKWTELANCRLVCGKWNYIAEPYMRKVGKVVLNDLSRKVGFKNPAAFNKVFENPLTIIPFTAFKINPILSVSIGTFKVFLKNQRAIMTDLTLNDVKLVTEKDKLANPFDISNWLGSKLSKLEVTQYTADSRVFIFSTDKLQSIKELKIRSCTVKIVVGEPKIKPRKIEMNEVRFVKTGQQVVKPRVNDFVDFSETKNIWFNNVKLDMAVDKSVSVDSMELWSCKILNWETSNWQIEQLKLYFLTFPTIRNEQIHLRVIYLSFCTINIAALPPTVEKLFIRLSNEITCTRPVNLPNLKYLTLWISDFSCLTHFSECHNLTQVMLTTAATSPFHFLRAPQYVKFSWLPRSLKVLLMEGDLKIMANRCHQINTLLLKTSQYQAAVVNRILGKLRPKEFYFETLTSITDKFKHIQCAKLLERPFQTCAIGRFAWGIVPFQNSPLSELLDKESEFYLLKKGKGKAISAEKFSQLTESFQKNSVI